MLIRTLLAASAALALSSAAAVPALADPVALQNATATFTQNFGGGVDASIDGNLGPANGWAVFDGDASPTNSQTAAYETVTDTLANAYTFTLSNLDSSNGQHTVGKFRLSVTTDDRSTFADGVDTGGDVTANWIELTPTSATATNGTVLTVDSADNTVEASGPNPTTSVYTITASSALLNVTGFRLEVLEDGDLPDGGPGRSGNGNIVLTEFAVDAVPEPAALSLIGLGGLLALRRRR